MSACLLHQREHLFYGAVMNFYDMLRTEIRRMAEESNLNQVAKKAGINRSGLKRFIDGERDLRGESLQKVIDNLGFQIRGPHFVDKCEDATRIKKEILAAVVTACWDSPIDAETRERIISAVTGKEPEAGYKQEAAGNS
jgi:hypothetical protein